MTKETAINCLKIEKLERFGMQTKKNGFFP
jgi:hypothetical protein